MLGLAFYKGKGTLVHSILRMLHGSQYSHVELVYGNAITNNRKFLGIDANGVYRVKRNHKVMNSFNPEEWDILEISTCDFKRGWTKVLDTFEVPKELKCVGGILRYLLNRQYTTYGYILSILPTLTDSKEVYSKMPIRPSIQDVYKYYADKVCK